jgi:SAM-dependent methyltransferase
VGKDPDSDQTERQRAFDALYEGTPLWEIGRPQSEVVRLFEEGAIRGRVLDVGCGTGENALYLAEQGLEVLGVDGSELAIEKARFKAAERGLSVRFIVQNALELESLVTQFEAPFDASNDTAFDVALDAGMFHSFTDEERPVYARSLTSVLHPGGAFYLICWSEHEPGTWGPQRVTQAEIRETFDRGWRIRSIRRAFWEENVEGGGMQAWLAAIECQT